MTRRFPDLEIYLKRTPTAPILAWLETEFSLGEPVQRHQNADQNGKSTTEVTITNAAGQSATCVIMDKAVKGGFISIWFKTNHTAWSTDLDCATAAYQYFSTQFKTEVRCSTGGWEGEDDGGWFRLTDEGVKTVNWFQ